MTRIALIVQPGTTPSSVMMSLDMVAIASRFPEGAACGLDLLSLDGGGVRLSSAVCVETQGMPGVLGGYAAVIISGFFAADIESLVGQVRSAWQPVIARLRTLGPETLVAASCYGTFVLAESGLLDDAPATTTWWLEGEFHRHFPRVLLAAEKALVDAGRCITAGAMTAHADLTLHVLRRLFGAALARRVGGIMLVDGARTSQRPFASLPRQFDDPLAQQAADWLAAHRHEPVSTRDAAAAAHVSYRTLHRRFQAAAGMAPLAYLQDLRVEMAKELLESTQLSFEQVVERTGYADVSAFRRLFARRVGLAPALYRQRFRQPGAGS